MKVNARPQFKYCPTSPWLRDTYNTGGSSNFFMIKEWSGLPGFGKKSLELALTIRTILMPYYFFYSAPPLPVLTFLGTFNTSLNPDI